MNKRIKAFMLHPYYLILLSAVFMPINGFLIGRGEVALGFIVIAMQVPFIVYIALYRKQGTHK